jgi:hypothetical protein
LNRTTQQLSANSNVGNKLIVVDCAFLHWGYITERKQTGREGLIAPHPYTNQGPG